MDEKVKLSRTAEAVRRIYRTKGINLSEDQGIAIASQLGKRPARAAILCVALIVALVAFLIIRFAW